MSPPGEALSCERLLDPGAPCKKPAMDVNLATDASRRERESTFHDGWARSLRPDTVLVDETFVAATAVENQHVLSQFGDVRGKRILDYGCGAGEGGVYLAKL